MKLTDHNEKVLKQFSDMMIERIEQAKAENWERGWMLSAVGVPQNIDGKAYRGGNVFMLMMLTATKGYKYPVFCTLNQANRLGAHINKGEKSMPVLFWDFTITTADGRKIKPEEYSTLTEGERLACTKTPFLKSYNVFNIEQTNLQEAQPERFKKIAEQFEDRKIAKDDKGMYANPSIDAMLTNQSWLCPIDYADLQKGAYYSPSEDKICVPAKRQFKRHRKSELVYTDGQEFYSTLLHEMIHSTGTAERLNRQGGKRFGDERYAKEELVAELGAARICSELGFASKVIDNSACYLDSWLNALKEEPTFILTVITEVEKAAQMVLGRIKEAA